MTKEELDFIGAFNMCDEISNEAYKKIVCHFEGQEPKTIQEKQAKSEKYDKAFDDGYRNGYAQARFDYGLKEIIQEIKQEPKTEWIPVSERLPEKDGQYLVHYDFGDGSYDYKVLHYITKSNDLWDKGWNKLDDMFNKMVDWSVDMVAWMPLPEPYKESEG